MWQATSLLIIDDDRRLLTALQIYLEKRGFDVRCAASGQAGLQMMYRRQPDLVILDIMMPEMDGWEVCRRIRQLSDVPLIMLTARDQEEDKLTGFRLGADDYVAKPFSMRELAIRVENMMRRCRAPLGEPDAAVITDGELFIDMGRVHVYRDGQPIDLTSTERRLLFYLAENPNRILTHRQILEHVWGTEYVDDRDYTKLFIWRLRQKIEPVPEHPQYILTERGIGYRFRLSS